MGQNVHRSQPRILDISILKDSYLPAYLKTFPENDNSRVGQAQLEIEMVAMSIAMMSFIKASLLIDETLLYFELTNAIMRVE